MVEDTAHPGGGRRVEVVPNPGRVPDRGTVERGLAEEGLTPRPWANAAGFRYGRHSHGQHKVLVCVSGAIVFHIDGADVVLGPGDRMELSPGVDHSATVGEAGVECVEAYRAPRPV